MAKNKKYYVVWVGRAPGIYQTWEECKAQVHQFEQARFKSFTSKEEAELAYSQSFVSKSSSKEKSSKNTILTTSDSPIYPSWSVDAACAGNPGKMEYRGVDTQSKEEIFKFGPFELGTNNIGEFLAIVHALALMKKENLNYPIYSDSATGISWIKQKKAKSNLIKNAKTEKLWQMIERAEKWLQNNQFTNQIIKWPTEIWGEIPADFGRK